MEVRWLSKQMEMFLWTMNSIGKQKGFTLIEMLIVLSVMMIISLFSFHSFQSYYERKKLDNFMEQLEEDLLFTQMMAMANQRLTKIFFLEDNYTITYYDNDSSEEKEIVKYYGDGIKIDIFTSSMNRMVCFNINGNVKDFGKFRVKYKKRKYYVVFQLGRGRFYIE